jgi:hypothetical protein
MDKRIIYKNLDGGVSVIIPAEKVFVPLEQKASLQGITAQEYLDKCYAAGMTPELVADSLELTVEEIAAKDVPTGSSYKIVDVADIPQDRNERDAWDVDATDLTDGVGK